MNDRKIKLGLFGFGCVGQGLYDVLNHSQVLEASVEKICVKDRSKKRKIDSSYFTFDKADILTRNNLDVVVELIDDADEAFKIVSEAMRNGVNVVTANKKMLAENFAELYALQKEYNVALLYEGSAGGSIPIIRNLEEYYDNELLDHIEGIVNGSSNYLLTRMEVDGLSYDDALKLAQEAGFAESDPWLDVAGFDSKYKLCLLTIHAFGMILKPDQILNLGISNVTFDDIQFAKQRDMRIKLVAKASKTGDQVRVYVLPQFVERGKHLYNIMYEYNAIEVEGAYSDRQTLAGKGAGSYPTGSAVLSDISALTYDYKYAYKKLEKSRINGRPKLELDTDFELKLYIRFNDREDIKKLEITSIEEEYRSANLNYVVANVKFNSLFNIYNDRKNELFVCVMPE
ncbi:MAG: homoserine dehydrogenase [Flavobacteriales bacterium]|nr:homoserine dehydrogenase [Flavobacteriales bacterium]